MAGGLTVTVSNAVNEVRLAPRDGDDEGVVAMALGRQIAQNSASYMVYTLTPQQEYGKP